MAEWFKAHAWKVCVLLKVPRVRIPVSPPKFNYILKGLIQIKKINREIYMGNIIQKML